MLPIQREPTPRRSQLGRPRKEHCFCGAPRDEHEGKGVLCREHRREYDRRINHGEGRTIQTMSEEWERRIAP